MSGAPLQYGRFAGDRIGQSPAEGEGLALSLATAVLRHWRLVAVTTFLVCVATIGVGLIQPRQYEVSTSFMPQSRRSASNFSGIAAQFGINFPQAEPGQSPQFYGELIKSSEILRAVANQTFNLPTDAGRRPGSLVQRERLKSPQVSEGLLLERAIARLRRQIPITISAKTGIITAQVRDEDPVLARDIASALIAQVVRFNQETRQSQASAERKFTEQRLQDAAAQLRAAEERSQAFAASNRGIGSASMLHVEQERLARDVNTRQEVYTMLENAFEQAKIDEVRDTPVITVLEPPRIPAAPLSRGLAIRGLLALLIGAIFGVLLALLRDRIGVLRRASVAVRTDLAELRAQRTPRAAEPT